MSTNTKLFGLHRLINQHFDDAVEQTRMVLQAGGFEILADINLTKVLEKKAQEHIRRHRIFVVCYPELADRALTIAPLSGALLLCNVALSHLDDMQVEVTITVPLTELGAPLEPHLKPIADELSSRLEHVIFALK